MILILATSTALRFFFYFVFLPRTPSAFGPDEGTYAALAKYVSSGSPVQEFPLYGPKLYNSVKTITLPSALLIKLGFNELDAVRLISSLYGLASLFFMALAFVAFQRRALKSTSTSSEFFCNKSILFLTLFAFMPSNFIWSTIGLRESGSQFWLIATFYFLLKMSFSVNWKSRIYAALSLLSMVLAHGTRPETALIFSFVSLFYSLIHFFKSRKFAPVLVISLGLIFGQFFTATPKFDLVGEANPIEVIETKKSIDPIETLRQRVLTAQILEYKRNINSLNAESALPVSTCVQKSRELIVLLKCNFEELPYRLFAFLFRPLLFFDKGSPTLEIAAIENIGWSILIFSGLVFIFRSNQDHLTYWLKFGLASYIVTYSMAAALYEGNLGTAFRHKSTILWPLIFIILINCARQSGSRVKTR